MSLNKILNLRGFWLWTLTMCLSFSVHSQTIEKKIYETHFTDKEPVIDGLLNDECWDKVDWANGFIQRNPKEMFRPLSRPSFQNLV